MASPGVVVDNNLTDEIMVTVIATGFNKKAVVNPQQQDRFAAARPRGIQVDHIPSGVRDLQKFDTPTYMRRGISVNPLTQQEEPKVHNLDQSNQDLEKPAFLRRIMD